MGLSSYIIVIVVYSSASLFQPSLSQSDDIISSTLYCQYEGDFYEVNSIWSDQCYQYNCTSIGILVEALQECGYPESQFEESFYCPEPSRERTDRQSCCTDELFCPTLPPHYGRDPPVEYGCPDGWYEYTNGESEGGDGSVCMKRFNDPKTHSEARAFCHSKGSYLLNHESSAVYDFIINADSSATPQQEILGGDAYWTGLYDDGNIFAWDGFEPEQPLSYSIFPYSYECEEGQWYSGGSKWSCDYNEQWGNLTGPPCIAASLNNFLVAEGETDEGPMRSVSVSFYQLANCEEKKPFVCYGPFSKSSFQLRSDSIRCDDGWQWNYLTRGCLKYISSDEARPNYMAAVEHCDSLGSSIYKANSKERQYVLYEIMNSRDSSSSIPKAFSVWVGDSLCEEIKNPYIAGTPGLNSTRNTRNCYSQLPYVCVKPENQLGDSVDLKARLSHDVSNGQYLVPVCQLINHDDEAVILTRSSAVFITPELNLESSPNRISLPVNYYQGGPYQCVMSADELPERVYSNIVTLDDNGDLYYMVMTIPLYDHKFEGFYNMVPYYQFSDDRPNILDVESIVDRTIEDAFQLSLEYILNPELCIGCINAKLRSTTTQSVQKIYKLSSLNGGAGTEATALVAFYVRNGALEIPSRKKRQIGVIPNPIPTIPTIPIPITIPTPAPNITDIIGEVIVGSIVDPVVTGLQSVLEEVNEWALLDSLMLENIIEVLNLNETEAALVKIVEAGQCSARYEYIPELETNITLPTTPVGLSVTFSKCGFTGIPLVTAKCQEVNGGAVWDLTVNTCDQSDMDEKSRKLRDISLVAVTTDNIISVIEETSELVTEELNTADVTYVAEILNNVVDRPISDSEIDRFFRSALNTVNSVLDVPDEIIDEAQNNAQSSNMIVKALEQLARTPLVLNQRKNIFQTVRPNLAYRLTTEPGVNGIVSLKETLTADSVIYVNTSNTDSTTETDDDKVVSLIFTDPGLGQTLRKAFLVYGNNKLHRTQESLKSADRIVSATVTAADGTDVDLSNSISNLVTIHYPKTVGESRRNATEFQCGFWVPGTNLWLTEGCITTITEQEGIICSCNHLTDFSVLLDINRGDETTVEEIHYQVLSIISLIGLAVSIAALGLVVLTAVMYKRLRKTNSQKVLVCLALCLLGLDISFVVGIDRVETYIGCVVSAVLMHYFLLASFAWMFVEAILQYLRFVKVLGTYIPRFMLKATIPAFGLPLIIVAVVLAVDFDLYKAGDDYCWMKTEAIYYAVLIPIGLVLIANTVVFGMVVHGLVCARRRMKAHQVTKSERKTALLHVKAGIAVFVVLGLTWIFGYLALFEVSTLAFQYLFCIFNSIQGLLIFIFHNIREPTVQQKWRELCCCLRKDKSSTAQIHSTTNGYSHPNHKNKKMDEFGMPAIAVRESLSTEVVRVSAAPSELSTTDEAYQKPSQQEDHSYAVLESAENNYEEPSAETQETEGKPEETAQV